MMSMTLYQDIIKTIQATKLRDCQDVLERKYPSVPYMTLGSVFSNYVQKSMKMNHGRHNVPEKIQEYYLRYKKAVANREEPGIIVKISDEIRISPVLVAKFILEAFVLEQHERKVQELKTEEEQRQGDSAEEQSLECSKLMSDNDSSSQVQKATAEPPKPLTRSEIKTEVNRFLRDTTSIPDRYLGYEVYLCTVYDDNYGPLPDAIKRTVGKEYEVRLRKLLVDQGVLHLEEDQLRKQGYDKTPDFKLEAPVAIDGNIITWIESKATFGDEETHQNYVRDQLTSYYNRFGPGVVIYWLGYVDTIQQTKKSKGIFVYDHLPTSITKYDPNI